MEASGRLVGPPVFKTGEGSERPLAGSIPVRLRHHLSHPTKVDRTIDGNRTRRSISPMEIAIIALAAVGVVFAGIALNQAKPKVRAERVPGHPDIFELWNEGPGSAVIVHADVLSPGFPRGASISDAVSAIPGLWVDERIVRDHGPWAKGAALEPLRRFEIRLPAATSLRIVYRADGALGTIATAKMLVDGGH